MKKVNKVAKSVVVEVVAIKGRPVNENSARQLRLKELAAKKEAGLLKKGRPVDVNSERQNRLKVQALNKILGIKQGRPVDKTSARQLRLAELEAKKAANGGIIKRGRPAAAKVEAVVEVKAKAKAKK